MAVRDLPFPVVSNPTKAQIGEWLRAAREAARQRAPLDKRGEYAQAEVAHRLGVRERAVRMWEKGRTAPPADQFLELVRLYGADITEIVHPPVAGLTPEQRQAFEDELAEIHARRDELAEVQTRKSAKQAGHGKGRRASNGGR